MPAKKRILFIVQEMAPYLELTGYAAIVNRLAIRANETGLEVRVIMPKFGTINERRHRLHEVVRLSGINIIIDNDDYPLIIKVASLPTARLQVYFLDNEDYFKRKFVFNDESGVFYEDNANRAVFFCKGALETVKKFGWPPDIIHCGGWMTALVPMYLKTAYKKEPVFADAKVVYTLDPSRFTEKLGTQFLKKAMISNQIREKDMDPYKEGSHSAMNRGAAIYSDAIALSAEKTDQKLLDELKKDKSKLILPFQKNNPDVADYLHLYQQLYGDK
ncbi:MAG TPA: glycogen/starch synthase [Chitinophagaceae bacterium]|nr:glycogen/starch synthase [Chitinophagaceae bacterium]